MKRFGLYLSEQQLKALMVLCEKDGLSLSEHIRRAISEYLDKYIGIRK